MDAITAIQTRRSIRSFQQKTVEREVLDQIVAAAAYAPSWKNTQTTRYYIVTNREIIEKIAREGVLGFSKNTETLLGVPVLVVEATITGRSGFERDGSYSTNKKDGWQMYDAGIAAQTFCLAAHAHGLGTLILGIFDDSYIAELIGIPQGQQVSALIAVGYPDTVPQAPPRKDVEVLRTYVEAETEIQES